jgi:TolB-like protein
MESDVNNDQTPPEKRPMPFAVTAVLFALAVVLTASLMIRITNNKGQSDESATAALPPQAQTPLSLAVLGFENISEDSQTQWVSTALSELLTAELAAGDELVLVSRERIVQLQNEDATFTGESLAPDVLVKLREKLGADYVVVGSHLNIGDDLSVQLRLQNTWSGETILSFRTDGSKEGLVALASEAAYKIRSELGFE